MSGGSMDYLYLKVGDAEFHLTSPERRAFQSHLLLVATALQEIEWVDSGDSKPGSETEAILACISPSLAVEQMIQDAKSAMEALSVVLARVGQKAG